MRRKKTYLLPLSWLLLLPLFCAGQPLRSPQAYAQVAFRTPAPEQAIAYLDKACQLAVAKHQFRVAASYRQQLGSAFYGRADYIHSIQQTRRSLSDARHYDLMADTLTFACYNLLASAYSKLTMSDSAAYWYYQVDELLHANPSLSQRIPADVDAYYYNRSLFHMRQGDQDQAIQYSLRSVEMARRMSDKRSVALSLLQLANTYFSIHQYEAARQYYQQSLRAFPAESPDACWGYTLLGNCLRAAGQPADGLRWLVKSQTIYERLQARRQPELDPDFVIESAYYRGKCEQRLGLDEAAWHSYQTAIETHRRQHGERGELIAASWTGQAAIALRRHQFHAALRLSQQALIAATIQFDAPDPALNPTAEDTRSGRALYEALHLKGQIWFDLYRSKARMTSLQRALDAYGSGLQVAQRIRRSFTQSESSYFFNEAIHPCVEHALEAYAALQPHPTASRYHAALFNLLQSYQAMGMADALHEQAAKCEVIPAGLLQEEQQLRQQLIAAQTQLIGETVRPDRQLLTRRVDSLKQQFGFLNDRLARRYPRYYALKYANQHLPLASLQQRLDNQSAYVSYFAGERFLYGFLVTRTRVLLFRRIMTPAYTQALTDLHQALSHNPGMFEYEGRPAANRLFDYLIRPIDTYLQSVQRLIVERDGLLNNVPFDVLEAAGQPEAYLCRRLAISYSYSAHLTFPATPPLGSAALRPACFAPFSDELTHRGKHHETLPLLRHSLTEIRPVGGEQYVNAQATKAQFLRSSQQANLLHLATHATANDTLPAASAIGFYPDTTDNLLRTLEIVNLPLSHIRLVVLSACDGNRGALRKAEGVLSLARAFRMAGCPTILTTTWAAHNETTSEQMASFYAYLHQGMPADKALQQARLDFLGSPLARRWGHPYYWANFTLIGDGSVSFPTSSPTPWAVLLLGMLVCGLLIRHRPSS